MLSFQSDNRIEVINKLLSFYSSLEEGSVVIDNPLGYKLLLVLSCKIREEIEKEYKTVPFADFMDSGYRVHGQGLFLNSFAATYPCSVKGNWYRLTGPSSLEDINQRDDFTWEVSDFALSATIFYVMDLLDLSYEDVTEENVNEFLEENELEYYCGFYHEDYLWGERPDDCMAKIEERKRDMYRCFLGAYYIQCAVSGKPFPQKYLEAWERMDEVGGRYVSTVSYYQSFLDEIRSVFGTDEEYRFALPGYLYALFSLEQKDSGSTILYSCYAYGGFDKYREICGFTNNPLVEIINKIADILMHPLTFSVETEGFDDMKECLNLGIPMEESRYDEATGSYFCRYMCFEDMEGVQDRAEYLCLLNMIFDLGVHYLYSIKDRLLAEAA